MGLIRGTSKCRDAFAILISSLHDARDSDRAPSMSGPPRTGVDQILSARAAQAEKEGDLDYSYGCNCHLPTHMHAHGCSTVVLIGFTCPAMTVGTVDINEGSGGCIAFFHSFFPHRATYGTSSDSSCWILANCSSTLRVSSTSVMDRVSSASFNRSTSSSCLK